MEKCDPRLFPKAGRVPGARQRVFAYPVFMVAGDRKSPQRRSQLGEQFETGATSPGITEYIAGKKHQVWGPGCGPAHGLLEAAFVRGEEARVHVGEMQHAQTGPHGGQTGHPKFGLAASDPLCLEGHVGHSGQP